MKRRTSTSVLLVAERDTHIVDDSLPLLTVCVPGTWSCVLCWCGYLFLRAEFLIPPITSPNF